MLNDNQFYWEIITSFEIYWEEKKHFDPFSFGKCRQFHAGFIPNKFDAYQFSSRLFDTSNFFFCNHFLNCMNYERIVNSKLGLLRVGLSNAQIKISNFPALFSRRRKKNFKRTYRIHQLFGVCVWKRVRVYLILKTSGFIQLTIQNRWNSCFQ